MTPADLHVQDAFACMTALSFWRSNKCELSNMQLRARTADSNDHITSCNAADHVPVTIVKTTDVHGRKVSLHHHYLHPACYQQLTIAIAFRQQ